MRIAIVGGGVGAMTAAYHLSNPGPDGLPPEHDITVYQLGWRLGGKGASGRNREKANRIEEHGLHLWMGFYANAFKMMRAVYGELGRPSTDPLATWQDAFKGQTVFTLMEERNHRWMANEWVLAYPPRPGLPGDQTGFPSPCGYLGAIVDWARLRIERFITGFEHLAHPFHKLPEGHRLHLHGLHETLKSVSHRAGQPHQPGTKGNPGPLPHEHTLLRLALEGVQVAIGIGLDLSDDFVGMQRALNVADMSVAMALGILRDLCGTTDWTVIDDQEWRHWLRANGLHKKSEWCTGVRSFYDFCFAYREGKGRDPDAADVAAGSATCEWLRFTFDYYEALIMRMQASMGETVFTPLYQLLQQRKVKFEFFHRLRDVVPSADGNHIDELHIGVQIKTIDGKEYQPLFDFKGIGCWPTEPFYEQLENGQILKESGANLEDYDADWPDVEELVLKRGQDFDLVVFGLSLGAVPFVCKKILDQKQAWRDMVEHVEIIETQAYQFWLRPNLADLGWAPALDGRCYGQRAVLSTFAEPCATWLDNSHLLPIEGWDVPVRHIAYFCGPTTGGSTYDSALATAKQYLEHDAGVVWPYTTKDGQFRYGLLVVNDPKGTFTDEERFTYQFFRINNQPTEKYVLSVAGSTKYRLDPAVTGYDNLVLTGDWVKTGMAIGCVEGAVLGGMRGVRNYCPGMQIIE